MLDQFSSTVGMRSSPEESHKTRWPCRSCRGRGDGCESCEGTGLQYRESVQDIIGDPVKADMGAFDTSFHGMGREDIDVRCLGCEGRSFWK